MKCPIILQMMLSKRFDSESRKKTQIDGGIRTVIKLSDKIGVTKYGTNDHLQKGLNMAEDNHAMDLLRMAFLSFGP